MPKGSGSSSDDKRQLEALYAVVFRSDQILESSVMSLQARLRREMCP